MIGTIWRCALVPAAALAALWLADSTEDDYALLLGALVLAAAGWLVNRWWVIAVVPALTASVVLYALVADPPVDEAAAAGIAILATGALVVFGVPLAVGVGLRRLLTRG